MAAVSLSEHSGATAAVATRKVSAALWIVQSLLALVKGEIGHHLIDGGGRVVVKSR